MEPRYEIFDHTADMGMRVYAPTMSALLIPAAQGLYAMIGELASREPSPGASPSGGRAGTGMTDCLGIDLTGDEPAIMLRDYLDELLVRFERDMRIAIGFDEAELTESRLHTVVRLAAVDESRSAFHREVKAITYHELDIVPVEGGFQATVIVDI